MFAGKAVRPSEEWIKSQGVTIMERALKAKFNSTPMRNKLKSTGKRIIAEATRNMIWGIGHPFRSSDVLNPPKFAGKNLLGAMLMKMRDELTPSSPQTAKDS